MRLSGSAYEFLDLQKPNRDGKELYALLNGCGCPSSTPLDVLMVNDRFPEALSLQEGRRSLNHWLRELQQRPAGDEEWSPSKKQRKELLQAYGNSWHANVAEMVQLLRRNYARPEII